VTFDEHGGTYDHVPPPAAASPEGSESEEGFKFDRLGVRIPTVIVSAWVDERRVVTDNFQSTSVIRTVRDWWGLAGPLTVRDAAAPSLLPVLSRSAPRPAQSWPEVKPRKLGKIEQAEEDFLRLVERLDSPIERLEKDLLADALAHEAAVSATEPLANPEKITHKEAHEHIRRISTKFFPGIVGGRQQ